MISEKIRRRTVLALVERMGIGMLAAAAWPWGASAQGQRKNALVIGWDISDSKYMDPAARDRDVNLHAAARILRSAGDDAARRLFAIQTAARDDAGNRPPTARDFASICARG